jgi:hypothetical protein
MLMQFVAAFDNVRNHLTETFRDVSSITYDGLLRTTIKAIAEDMSHNKRLDYWDGEIPDPDRITVIDDGDYQGSLVFVIGARGYQPSSYWLTRAAYGSCSACDTLQGILDEQDPNARAQQLMTLALHMVQRLKEV